MFNCILCVEVVHIELQENKSNQLLSNIGKEMRKSKTHVHTTGATSYANTRADFVSGVHSLLRTREYKSASTIDNSPQLQARMSGLEKQNQELRNLLLQTLQAVRDGKISDNAFNGIQFALSNPNSQVNPVRNDDGTRNESDDLDPPSSS